MLDNVLSAQNPWWIDPVARPREAGFFRREIQSRILRRLMDPADRRAAVVLGPRQVGKTVVLKQLVADLLDDGCPPGNVLYLDLSDERITAAPSPREVASHVPIGHRCDVPRVVLLDEIGRFPGWDLWLKQAVDEGEDRFVVTDSAAALLTDERRESGLGRWDEYELETFSFVESMQLLGRKLDDLGPPVRGTM